MHVKEGHSEVTHCALCVVVYGDTYSHFIY